jgi:hypothetical protein
MIRIGIVFETVEAVRLTGGVWTVGIGGFAGLQQQMVPGGPSREFVRLIVLIPLS